MAEIEEIPPLWELFGGVRGEPFWGYYQGTLLAYQGKLVPYYGPSRRGIYRIHDPVSRRIVEYTTIPPAKEPPPPKTYTLTISAGIGGTTDPSVGQYEHPEGTTVEVTAIPNANYIFFNWLFDGMIEEINPVAVYMNRDHRLIARFKKIEIIGYNETEVTKYFSHTSRGKRSPSVKFEIRATFTIPSDIEVDKNYKDKYLEPIFDEVFRSWGENKRVQRQTSRSDWIQATIDKEGEIQKISGMEIYTLPDRSQIIRKPAPGGGFGYYTRRTEANLTFNVAEFRPEWEGAGIEVKETVDRYNDIITFVITKYDDEGKAVKTWDDLDSVEVREEELTPPEVRRRREGL